MTLLIRQAELKDAFALAEVHVRTWQHAYHGQLPDQFLAGLSIEQRTTQWKDWLSYQSPLSSVSAAVNDGSIVGFSWVDRCRDDDVPVHTGERYAIYVLPMVQGKGIGKGLINAAVDRLRTVGCQLATLWVLESNSTARRFYEHHGWSPDGSPKTEQWQDAKLVEMRYRITLRGKE